jgi:hypothetical protein
VNLRKGVLESNQMPASGTGRLVHEVLGEAALDMPVRRAGTDERHEHDHDHDDVVPDALPLPTTEPGGLGG